jgi:hypothetical protein
MSKMIYINSGDHATRSMVKKFKLRIVSWEALLKCLRNMINVSKIWKYNFLY